MKAPGFWWKSRKGLRSWLMSPISMIYASVADRPFGHGADPGLPVICVGNFVAGGAGKTPTTLHLAERAKEAGLRPALLTRGYGGRLRGPCLVDPEHHTARDVGDEALLLAECAETVVAKDRRAGIATIKEELASDLVIMDDGFQSQQMKPTHALLVVDATVGLGNGCVIPSGPLRARLETQIAHADSLFVIAQAGPGTSQAATVASLKEAFLQAGKLIIEASSRTRIPDSVRGKKIIAFAGIGRPEKFFDALQETDCNLLLGIPFDDHHRFSEQEAGDLMALAKKHDAVLVTTAKDRVRLKGGGKKSAALLESCWVAEQQMDVPDGGRLIDLIKSVYG